MAQTSVEWLFDTLAKTPMTEWYDIREEAIKKHKEETLRFVRTMPKEKGITQEGQSYVQYDAEAHYNETFK